jgi:hypothetical protein
VGIDALSVENILILSFSFAKSLSALGCLSTTAQMFISFEQSVQ